MSGKFIVFTKGLEKILGRILRLSAVLGQVVWRGGGDAASPVVILLLYSFTTLLRNSSIFV